MYLLALVTKTEVCPLIKEHADILVGQLVAKAVFVRVVNPFGDPQEGLRPGQTWWISGGWGDGELI